MTFYTLPLVVVAVSYLDNILLVHTYSCKSNILITQLNSGTLCDKKETM